VPASKFAGADFLLYMVVPAVQTGRRCAAFSHPTSVASQNQIAVMMSQMGIRPSQRDIAPTAYSGATQKIPDTLKMSGKDCGFRKPSEKVPFTERGFRG